MNKCKNCDVFVMPQHKKCPLCGVPIESTNLDSDTRYPDYSKRYMKQKTVTVKKVLMFVSVMAALGCSYANIFTAERYDIMWSVIVIASLVFAWSFYRTITAPNINAGGRLLMQYAIISIFLMIIDATTGFHKWSTTYVIPFLTVALSITFVSLANSKKKLFKEYFGYFLATCFISLCPLLFFLFSFSKEAWTSMIALLVSLVAALGMIIFSDESFKEEMKKRFHWK